MFEEFIKDVTKHKKEKNMVPISLDNPLFSPEMYRQKLKHIDSIQDRELFALIKSCYENLLNDIVKEEFRSYINLFTNIRFLTIFIQVMNTVKLPYHSRIHCNKIAYDYLTITRRDPYIEQLLYSLSRTVNRDVIPGLLGIGLPEDLASYMVLARFSSTKELINVKRLNHIIVTSPIHLMTEQTIVWIYEKLFDRVTPLFEGVMFDVVDTNELTEEQQEIYSTISLAALLILNNMPSPDIRKVLISYVGDYMAMYYQPGKKCVRFSVDTLSSDYKRILDVVELLKRENIYVP